MSDVKTDPLQAQESRWAVSPAAAAIESPPAGRPGMLWVVVTLTSLPVLANFLSILALLFLPAPQVLKDRFNSWSLTDYFFNYYPVVLIVVGIVLLIRRSRWAVVPFLIVTVRVIYIAIVRPPSIAIGQELGWIVWTPIVYSIAIQALATGYCLYLTKKGVCR